jgi:hypothetical protein
LEGNYCNIRSLVQSPVTDDTYSLSRISTPLYFVMSKNWNQTGLDWTRIYQGDVSLNQLTISSDGVYLYFLLITVPMTIYKMNESNGNLLKQYRFIGVNSDYEFSRIVFNSGLIFVSGKISGNGSVCKYVPDAATTN